ncbi:MAG: translation elongation factor 4 [Gracilibacteraceae bacterium]|jgi:GTP-binding protein LepA|nr:translation elongation factor 4 [Gracilibacteraceae bacterium]
MAQASPTIRNFCIIAHIDHGKSTLADRLIEYTGAMSARELKEQVLDSMDLERERGITIKLQAVRLRYPARDGQIYELNLIDTPGHVDFSYEVSRSLAACEGALLVVDAAQGIEAQTLANVYLALENDLEIIPIINKIDLPGAEPERVKEEIEEIIGLDSSGAILASAKNGVGIEEILEAIVRLIPPPRGDDDAPLRALIFDSKFDSYRGAIPYLRVFDGSVRKGDQIRMMATGKNFEVTEVGIFTPHMTPEAELKAGTVGYVAGSIKNVADTRVGDTVTDDARAAAEPLPGYKKAVSMVFCGMYPIEASDFGRLKDALEKLRLNDASLMFENETSAALGFGFRCGFLGLLHMEIIQERLEREFDIGIITTAPSVVYRVTLLSGESLLVDNPALMPPAAEIAGVEEPVVRAVVMTPAEFVGAIMELNQEKRGAYIALDYLTQNRVSLSYDIPLSEIVYDYFDQLKSRSKGYASLDYELRGYHAADLVKLDIMLNGEVVDALSFIVHRDKAYVRGRKIVEKLRRLIPRQLFEVPVQAAVGSRVIARETIRALRKDVLAKCYGGDITRKRKLLEKQKEGKKRMKQVGSVEIPQDAFMAILERD